MIGRTFGIGMIGSDTFFSCINTNSTQISIARTTVTACHRSQRCWFQRCWFQFRKTTKCFECDKVYINVNYRRQTSINPENQRTNTEIVAILIWFLGTCALPFLFRWASTTCALWRTCMFNTGTNRKAMHSELVAAHVISRDFAAPWLYLCCTCVTVYKMYWPSETKMAAHRFLSDFGVSSLIFRIDWRQSIRILYAFVLLTFCAIHLEKFTCISHE